MVVFYAYYKNFPLLQKQLYKVDKNDYQSFKIIQRLKINFCLMYKFFLNYKRKQK